jgi:hypothetical protein
MFYGIGSKSFGVIRRIDLAQIYLDNMKVKRMKPAVFDAVSDGERHFKGSSGSGLLHVVPEQKRIQ